MYLCVTNEVFFNSLYLAPKYRKFSRICVFLCVEVPRWNCLEVLHESRVKIYNNEHTNCYGDLKISLMKWYIEAYLLVLSGFIYQLISDIKR